MFSDPSLLKNFSMEDGQWAPPETVMLPVFGKDESVTGIFVNSEERCCNFFPAGRNLAQPRVLSFRTPCF